jgi:hypothetical protein
MEFCRAGVLAHVTETIHGKFGTTSVKRDGRLKVFRVVRAVKDQSLTALNTSQFTDA